MSQLKLTSSSVYIAIPLREQLDIWTIMLSFSCLRKSNLMCPEALVHCSIIGLILRERYKGIGNEEQQNFAHLFIAATAAQMAFFQ